MTSAQNHEHRITTLETRVAEIESCHGESIYAMKRDLKRNDLRWATMFKHFNFQDVTEEAVDEALDQE